MIRLTWETLSGSVILSTCSTWVCIRSNAMLFSRQLTFWFCSLLVLSTTIPSSAEDRPTGAKTILPPGAKLEKLWNDGEFTEGVAVGPEGAIYFSDIPRGFDTPGRVLRFDPRTGRTTVHAKDSRKSNGLMFSRQGKLLAACGSNNGAQALCRIESDGRVIPLVERYQGKRFNSPNDLVIHPDGSVYFTDPRYIGPEPIELDHMSVYRFDPKTGSLRRVAHEITKPNGVILSPDAKTLYIAETNNGTTDVTKPVPEGTKPKMTLNAYPIRKDGTLGQRKILVDFGQQLGIDGMTVDVEGHIYAAVRSEQRHGIRIYRPDGTEIAYIPTPGLPTNCCFGIGKEKSMLYVTVETGLYRIPLKIPGYHPAIAH